MSKKSPKPQSQLAKADAAITAGHRKMSPTYDRDVVEYGQRVADFNAGFLEGDSNGREDVASNVLPVFHDLSGRVKGKWTNKQRRDWNRAEKLMREAVVEEKARKKRHPRH